MTFSCPHHDPEREYCMRLHRRCVPGQPGCVLRGNSVFAIPVETRLAQLQEDREAPGPER